MHLSKRVEDKISFLWLETLITGKLHLSIAINLLIWGVNSSLFEYKMLVL